MSAWWHVLGAPELTAEVRATIIRGVREQTQSRSTHELAAQRDEILLGLLSLRRNEI
jgi:hypothetical protein